MSFADAVRSGFDHYTKFDGRANRPAFWYWVLFGIGVGAAANLIGAAVGGRFLIFLVWIALLLPGISVAIRRLHDTGRSGWWILIGLIPLIGAIILIIFYVQESDAGDNEYGPPMSPTGAPAA
jgi:uncharacterized membrane protein YhaH (DUF805 family)